MTTYASIFTGAALADLGAIAAGFTPIWGIERDPEIGAVASQINHSPYGIIYGDATHIDPHTLPPVDHLHASPPCQDFSGAKADKTKRTNANGAIATWLIAAIRAIAPRTLTIENVPAYAQSGECQRITDALWDCGYWVQQSVVDAANFGVPQHRRRLIIRATHGGLCRPLPSPVVWQGWESAIEDLDLPPTNLTGWQKRAIAAQGVDPSGTFLIERSGARRGSDGEPANQILPPDQPCFTIRAMSGKVRASVWQCTAVIDGIPHRCTPRAIARLMSVPDDFQLPDDPKLAIRVLGNGVPPRMMAGILETMA
jgi:DNA (cytosine-5)-methyltransferase 1